MVAQTEVFDPEQKQKGVATTTAEARATKAANLVLSSLKLTKLPEGLDQLSSLTYLDISNNAITSIPEKSLPTSLVEVTVTGCQLTELPASLGTLPRLKKLFAGANRLQQVDVVFRSTSLQHVGLSYNRVSRLPPSDLLAGSPLLSLDLSHNDLEGLAATLTQLSALPSLAALSLGGNPLALAPRYTAEVRGRIKQLLYLDGQRMDLPANSRPGTGNSVAGSTSGRHLPPPGQPSQRALALALSAHAGAGAATSGPSAPPSITGPAGGRSYGGSPSITASGAGPTVPPLGFGSFSALGPLGLSPHQMVRFEEGGGGGADECTALTLTLRGLCPAEDPFGWLKARWDEQIATAEELGMTVPPTLEVPEPPLQPVIYYIELTDVEGTPLACVPLKLVPPTPPDVAVMFDPKVKAAAAAAAAKEAKKASKPLTPSKGKRGKAVATPPDPGAERQLETGLLKVTLPVRAVAEHRNWLRSGTTVTMYKTTLTAVPRPPSASEGAAAEGRLNTAKGTGGRKKKGDEPPPVEYDITSSTEVIGTAMLRAGAQVVDGYTTEGSERLDFVPPPSLFDECGVRLALKDPRRTSKPVGHVDVTVELHVQPPGWGVGAEG